MSAPWWSPSRTLQWLREVLAWLDEARWGWLTLVMPPFAAWGAFALCPTFQGGLKVGAMVLEVCGLLVVGRGLYKAQERFDPGKGTLWTRAQSYMRTFPPWRGRKPIIGNMSATLDGVSATGGTAILTASGGTTEEQLAQLQAQGKLDREAQAKTAKQLAQHQRDTEDRFKQEKHERVKGDEKTTGDVVELATGDLAAQVMGWLWLVIAAVLQGIP